MQVNAQTVLGVDVSKAKLDVCLLVGDRPCHRTVQNSPQGFKNLMEWLKEQQAGTIPVCLEATGLYGEDLAEFLYETGYRVSVVNPVRIKAHAGAVMARNKTDRGDAALIADFCRRHELLAWQPAPPQQRELRALVRHLRALVSMRQQERNRLQAGFTSEAVLTMLQQHVAFLTAQIEQLEQQIANHLDRHPDLKAQHDLLTSIKGIGDKTAATLLAEIRDFAAFDSARELVAFAGLNPAHSESGSSLRGKPHISRKGQTAIRAALYFPGISAMHSNPLIKPLCDRLVAEGNPNKVAITAAMRKLLHLAYGVLKTQTPFDPNYLSQQGVCA
jgi:transposase